MKVYKVPVYMSQTGLKELELCGVLFCRKTVLGSVQEIVTHDHILVVKTNMLEKINRKAYIKDTSIMYNRFHDRCLKSMGVVPYVLQEDVDQAKPVSREEVTHYVTNFENGDYHLLCSKNSHKVKNKTKY